MAQDLKAFLNRKVLEFNQQQFVETDPVSIPHLFTKKQDIEIAAFFAATFAWGNRTTIINKTRELMKLMDFAPYQFCIEKNEKDIRKLTTFKHRTFNSTDLLYFIEFFNFHYTHNDSLESAFLLKMKSTDETIENALIGFHEYFFSLSDAPARTKKHIATPLRGSTCKRLNMFLRWMVRKDDCGVDFGIWKSIKASQLDKILPTARRDR